MYLRKMGSVSLLTREGEVEIAKRIEEGQKQVLCALSTYPDTITRVLELFEKVEKEEKVEIKEEPKEEGNVEPEEQPKEDVKEESKETPKPVEAPEEKK